MNRALVLFGATAAVVIFGVVVAPLFVRHPKPPPVVEQKAPPRRPPPADGERRPTLLDQVQAAQPETRPASRMTTHTATRAPVEEKVAPPPGGVPALIGLEVEEPSADELRGLKVPEGMTGVVIRAVDPASPAAEAALKKSDVIVRAQRDKITTADSLRASIADRDHTLLTVYRDGYPFQVVLHKPLKSAP